jgi:hypothetical protein
MLPIKFPGLFTQKWPLISENLAINLYKVAWRFGAIGELKGGAPVYVVLSDAYHRLWRYWPRGLFDRDVRRRVPTQDQIKRIKHLFPIA